MSRFTSYIVRLCSCGEQEEYSLERIEATIQARKDAEKAGREAVMREGEWLKGEGRNYNSWRRHRWESLDAAKRKLFAKARKS